MTSDPTRIYATYRIETSHPLEKAASVMAGEQSAGTFVKVHGETPELTARFGARVERIMPLGNISQPALPGARTTNGDVRYQQAEVVVSFPFDNIGSSLTALMTAVGGNLYELSQFSGLKLIDVQIPRQILDAYAGPQFGIAGTRQLSGINERPLLGTIVKPSVGLSPGETAALVRELCEAGLDFIKDDELQSNAPYSPLEARVKAIMPVVRDHAQRSGHQVMYAFNITGNIDDMLRGHDLVLAEGGTCVMVNVIPVGVAALAHLRNHAALPIHVHRAGWGMFGRHPLLGMEYSAYQKFLRLAGADHLHVNGLQNKFCESDESVITSARAVLTPLSLGETPMPVFSSGQWAGQAPATYAALKSLDLIYLAGGGIMAHPSGPAAGVASLREAWEAALSGISLAEYARTHPALRESMEMFGAL